MPVSSIIKTSLLIAIGIFAANIFSEIGADRAIYNLFSPVFRFANLSPEIAMGAVVRALSPSAGYAMLGRSMRENENKANEIIAASLISSFPYHVKKAIQFYIPFILPVFGFYFFLKFTILRLFASFLQSLIGIAYGRKFITSVKIEKEEIKKRQRSLKEIIKNSFEISARVISIFIFVSILIEFALKNNHISFNAIERYLPLPEESIAVIIAQLANNIAGYAAAGEFFRKGVLTEWQAITTLFIGLIISTPRVYIQHSLPVAVSVFERKFGIKLIAIKAFAEMLTLAAALTIFIALS